MTENNDTLHEALAALEKEDCGDLPIVSANEDGKFGGIVLRGNRAGLIQLSRESLTAVLDGHKHGRFSGLRSPSQDGDSIGRRIVQTLRDDGLVAKVREIEGRKKEIAVHTIPLSEKLENTLWLLGLLAFVAVFGVGAFVSIRWLLHAVWALAT